MEIPAGAGGNKLGKHSNKGEAHDEHVHKSKKTMQGCCKASHLLQPEVVPPLNGYLHRKYNNYIQQRWLVPAQERTHQVPKPHVRQLVADKQGSALKRAQLRHASGQAGRQSSSKRTCSRPRGAVDGSKSTHGFSTISPALSGAVSVGDQTIKQSGTAG